MPSMYVCGTSLHSVLKTIKITQPCQYLVQYSNNLEQFIYFVSIVILLDINIICKPLWIITQQRLVL